MHNASDNGFGNGVSDPQCVPRFRVASFRVLIRSGVLKGMLKQQSNFVNGKIESTEYSTYCTPNRDGWEVELAKGCILKRRFSTGSPELTSSEAHSTSCNCTTDGIFYPGMMTFFVGDVLPRK
ncbi:hypothetical protein CDAR_377141 [Caerostris darwini]|uniref:Uncharacterized protein n=1 Tax=Caerostris darwini TaxID=1538125 RepID=A0AAV4URN5_9ARAC|nr:hypothetical protein CDAR_377141 [Caerostris darwini]